MQIVSSGMGFVLNASEHCADTHAGDIDAEGLATGGLLLRAILGPCGAD